MELIDVAASTPYTVHVGTGILPRAGELVRAACGGAKAVVVTDSNVGPLYADTVRSSLRGAGYEVSTFTFPAGEASKRLSTYGELLEFLCAHELTRSDAVVALGGGVTGDLAGFAAATYMRGVRLAQVPTSLLAMVDSSVGGKTAVDLSGGKNLAGSFYQPNVVIADVECLASLTPAQFADGCGEVIKHGFIKDPELFRALERTPLTVDAVTRDPAYVERVVAQNIRIKRDVVEQDEREAGPRKLLNFGHSFGHAVEAAEGYRLGHGTCVAIGMCMIARAAAAQGACAPEVPERLERVCAAHGLATATARSADELMAELLHDKKRAAAGIDLVVPHEVGACTIERTSLEEAGRMIERGLAGTGVGCAPEPARRGEEGA